MILQIKSASGARPVPGACINIQNTDGNMLFSVTSDHNGNTESIRLAALDTYKTLETECFQPAYSIVNVTVEADGYERVKVNGVEIVDGQTSILPVAMYPIAYETHPTVHRSVNIPGMNIKKNTYKNIKVFGKTTNTMVIPEYITVHLGNPSDMAAPNIKVPFIDYLKIAISGENYATSEYHMLSADVHESVTFALNRICTKWYQGRGYDFDITSSPKYDMYYRDGGPVFENINKMVDEMFNVYWDNSNLIPIEQFENIDAVYPDSVLRAGSRGEPVRKIQLMLNRIGMNYPGIPGVSNTNGIFDQETENAVREFQKAFLCIPDGCVGKASWYRISYCYLTADRFIKMKEEEKEKNIGEYLPGRKVFPGNREEMQKQAEGLLDKISFYCNTVPAPEKDDETEDYLKKSVLCFQKTCGLTANGNIGTHTWDKMNAVFRGIKNTEQPAEYPGFELRIGASDRNVRLMQQYISDMRVKYPMLPYIAVDGIFGQNTKGVIIAFQTLFNLSPDGVIGVFTWNEIVDRWFVFH